MNKPISYHSLDELLNKVLTKEVTPSPMLNRQILNKAKNISASMEEPQMHNSNINTNTNTTDTNNDIKNKITDFRSRRKLNTAVAAAIAAAVVVAGGGTAYAAYRYLTPEQVAENVSNNDKLTKAFSGKDAISINETQASGDYSFTLLGMVSGKGLSPFVPDDTQAKLSDKKTYATVAISRKDGGKMSHNSLCVSPLIGGVPFSVANNSTMDTTLTWFEQDGVLYELVECDDLEKFADRGVWLSVVENFGDETTAYQMDSKTGSYSKNDSYTGVSALFKMPFDESKADTAAADEYIKSLSDKAVSDDKVNDINDNSEALYNKLNEELANISVADIDAKYDEIKDHEVTATPDADGYINLTYPDDEGIECGIKGQIDYLISDDEEYALSGLFSDTNDSYGFSIIVRNSDGSFTLKEYHMQ